ncbi:hypothetical protein [Pseudomonas parasichuanensis]|uniref:hypothetical protein n=1 Tax=Pseudomonas parasichuanensis TaxID=2892329 RepID=UPI001F20149D|nr:hypothetical protein [Pseudomonas parasichuanensis]
MERSQGAGPRAKVSQLFAAALGAYGMYLVKRHAEPELASALMYFIPAVTLLASVLLGELEDWIAEHWSDYKDKSNVDQFLEECDRFLKNDAVDSDQKEEVKAKKNHALMARLDKKLEKINHQAPIGSKLPAKSSRRVNKRSTE